MTHDILKAVALSLLTVPMASSAMAQDADPARVTEFANALEVYGCRLSQADVQDFVLANGFADARETQAIVGSLMASGDARTEGADLVLQTAGCADASVATPAPAPQPIPQPVPQPVPQAVPQPAQAIAQCPSNALTLSANTQCACPANPTGTIWGSGTYTSDSSICTAALHAGAISGTGGNVTVILGGRLESFPGTAQNGVTSNTWGAYDSSFTVVPMQAVAPAPVPQPLPQAAAACPSFAQPGDLYEATGDQLYSPTSLSVQAGGTLDLGACEVGGIGFVHQVPHISVILSGMEAYGRLEIEVEAQCDTTLLVNTPTGQWMFDDDSRGNFQPLLNLPSSAAMNGRIDIWVGTYNGAACPATVELETWNS